MAEITATGSAPGVYTVSREGAHHKADWAKSPAKVGL